MNETIIKIHEYSETLFPDVLSLYQNAGWVNYTHSPDMLANAYKNSLRILCAYSGASMAGVIRAVGDGYSILYVQDLLVHSAFQHRGIGGLLLDMLLVEYPDVYQSVLLADGSKALAGFYQKHGFKPVAACDCVAYFKHNPHG